MERVDALNRCEFVNNLVKIIRGLSNTKKTASIALNGQWGCGKSFVLDMLEEKLSVFHSSQRDDNGKYFVFRYNCWQYDYYEEPIMAIVSSLYGTLNKYEWLKDAKHQEYINKFMAISRVGLEFVRQLTLNKLDIDLEELKKSYDGENEKQDFDKYFTLNEAIEQYKCALGEVAKERPVLIIVDELDRCLPEYAIKVLERLHHIFYGVENVVVLMAYDENQIAHTVEEIFGKGTDVNNYLRKFVDYRVNLDTGNSTQTFFAKFAFYFDRFNIQNEDQLFELVRKIYVDMDIRKIEKCIERINLIDTIADLSVRNESVCAAELIYMALNDFVFSKDGAGVFVNSICSYTSDSRVTRILNDGELKKYKELIALLRNTKDTHIVECNGNVLRFYDDTLGNAMSLVAKVYECTIHKNGYGIKVGYSLVNDEKWQSFRKFVDNVDLVL